LSIGHFSLVLGCISLCEAEFSSVEGRVGWGGQDLSGCTEFLICWVETLVGWAEFLFTEAEFIG
jgi:hypothetical protein